MREQFRAMGFLIPLLAGCAQPSVQERVQRPPTNGDASRTAYFLDVARDENFQHFDQKDLEAFAVRALLEAETPPQLSDVCELIGRRGLRSSTPRLVALLDQNILAIRWAAFGALRRLEATEIIPLLYQRLNTSGDSPQDTVALLGYLKEAQGTAGANALMLEKYFSRPRVATGIPVGESDSIIPELKKALHQPDLRIPAMIALALLDVQEAVPDFAHHLEDQSADVRRAAVSALALAGARGNEVMIVRLLEDSDIFVRQQAAIALGVLGDKTAIPALMGRFRATESYILPEIVATLERLQALEAVPDLKTLLEDRRVCEYAAAALCCLGNSDGVPILLHVAENRADYRIDGSPFQPDLLSSMNRLRNQDMWKRLKEMSFLGVYTFSYSDAGLVEILEHATGMRIEMSERAESALRVKKPYVRMGPSRNENALRLLNAVVLQAGIEARIPLTYVLEPERIVILLTDEGRDFWDKWWEEQRRK